MKQPENWTFRTVAEICDMRNGNGFGPADWGTVGLPIIRIQNLNGGTKFDYFSGKINERWVVDPGQILFSWAGTKGVSFGPTIWRGARGVLNQHIFKVEPKNGIDADWLYWALKHVTERIESQSHGFKSTLVHVKKSDIDNQAIFVPPSAEQIEIAKILLAWNKAIAVADLLSANSQKQLAHLKTTLLTGQRRFGCHIGWQKKFLSEIICESRSVGSSGDVAKKITVKLYGRGVVGKSEKRMGSENTKYYIRSQGQFIYSKLDFLNGAFGIIPQSLDGYESTLDLPAFDFLAEIDPRWFLHYVSREEFYSGHLGLASGGRKARRVNPSDLLKTFILTPSFDEQKRIADAIELASEIACAHKANLASLKKEKYVLMSQLLTGKRRVKLHEVEKEAQK